MDRNKPVIVHCRSGGRSTESLEIFRELGFKNVYHLDGGIMGKDWVRTHQASPMRKRNVKIASPSVFSLLGGCLSIPSCRLPKVPESYEDIEAGPLRVGSSDERTLGTSRI